MSRAPWWTSHRHTGGERERGEREGRERGGRERVQILTEERKLRIQQERRAADHGGVRMIVKEHQRGPHQRRLLPLVRLIM